MVDLGRPGGAAGHPARRQVDRDRRAHDASGDRVLEGARRRMPASWPKPPRSSATPWCATGARSAAASPTPIRPPTIPPWSWRSARRCASRARPDAHGCGRRVLHGHVRDGGLVRRGPDGDPCAGRHTGHGRRLRKIRASGVTLRGRRRGRGRHDVARSVHGARVAVTGATVQRHASHDARSRAHEQCARGCRGRCGVPGRNRCRRAARGFLRVGRIPGTPGDVLARRAIGRAAARAAARQAMPADDDQSLRDVPSRSTRR